MIPDIIGNTILKLDAVDSTNTYAATLLKNQNVTEGLVIQAVEQTAGRGQMGTIWHGKPGESLTFSVILTPSQLEVDCQFYLSMAISLGIYDYILGRGIHDHWIKWPNDIYIREKKVCGILIENSIRGGSKWVSNSIAGIGLNLNQSNRDLLPSATSVKCITGESYHIDEELKKLCVSLNAHYWRLKRLKYDLIKDLYLQKLWGTQGYVPIRKDGEIMQVLVKDIEHSGRLILEKEEDESALIVSFKEIEWIF